MVTKAEVDEYSAVIDRLSAVAFAQIKALLLSLDDPNPITFRDALLATYPRLMAPYMQAASEVAAVWYSTLRTGSGVSGRYVAGTAALASAEQLQAGARYALSPLFQPQRFIGSDILSLLAGFSQRMIADSGRDTITFNADRDRVQVGYQRVPRPGCCAFCGLMASRGAVYRSRESAGGVVGRGSTRTGFDDAGNRLVGGIGGGIKARGSQDIGSRYHNFCRCVVTPVFVGGDNDYLSYTQNHFTEMYQNVESADGSIRPIGEAVDLKDVLADWRHTHGTK